MFQFGQGALIIRNPAALEHPAPQWRYENGAGTPCAKTGVANNNIPQQATALSARSADDYEKSGVTAAYVHDQCAVNGPDYRLEIVH